MAGWREALYPPPVAPDVQPDPYAIPPVVPDVELPLDEWGFAAEEEQALADQGAIPEQAPTFEGLGERPQFDIGETQLRSPDVPEGVPGVYRLPEEAVADALDLRETFAGPLGDRSGAFAQQLGLVDEQDIGPSPGAVLAATPIIDDPRAAAAASIEAGTPVEDLTSEGIAYRRQLKREAEADRLAAERERVAAEQEMARVEAIKAEQQVRDDAKKDYERISIEWQQLQQREVDPNRWWKTRSTGQKIALYASAAVQGWLNPGGRNSTLELMERLINSDIEAQVNDIASGRANISQQMSLMQWNLNQGLGLEAAVHKSKAQGFEQALKELDAQAIRFDKEGTQAEDMELQKRILAEEQAKQEALAAQKQEEELVKRQREADKHAIEIAKARADIAGKYADIARGREGSRREDRKLDEARAEREAKQKRLERDPLYDAINRIGGDPEKDRDKYAAVAFPDGRVEAIRTTEPAKTEAYFNAARDMANGFDEILNMRDEAGRWTLSTADLAKEMQSVYGMMTLDAKNFFDLGAITEADAKLIERVIGGDPNAIRDFTALLEKSRAQIEQKVRGRLENAQVKGASSFHYPRLGRPAGEKRTLGDMRKEIRGGMKLGSFDDVAGTIDEALRKLDEKGDDVNFNYFLERVIKDASQADRTDVINYAKGRMK